MRVDAAVVREQGQTFAVVVVRPSVLSWTRARMDELAASMSWELFDGVPVVLMAQDGRGTPTYYGRDDIVKFLGSIFMEQLPWKHYTFSNAA